MSDSQHLQDAMNDLRAQIAALHPDDEENRKHLSGLVGHIERRLGTSTEVGAQAEVGDDLNASVLRFEASHPRISTLLNQLAEKLGTMGI